MSKIDAHLCFLYVDTYISYNIDSMLYRLPLFYLQHCMNSEVYYQDTWCIRDLIILTAPCD